MHIHLLKVFVKEDLNIENNVYKQKILETLTRASQPMDIEKIRVDAHIGNWQTALKHCLELLIANKINGQKTTKSWVFWSLPPKMQEEASEQVLDGKVSDAEYAAGKKRLEAKQ